MWKCYLDLKVFIFGWYQDQMVIDSLRFISLLSANPKRVLELWERAAVGLLTFL